MVKFMTNVLKLSRATRTFVLGGLFCTIVGVPYIISTAESKEDTLLNHIYVEDKDVPDILELSIQLSTNPAFAKHERGLSLDEFIVKAEYIRNPKYRSYFKCPKMHSVEITYGGILTTETIGGKYIEYIDRFGKLRRSYLTTESTKACTITRK